MRDSGYRCDQVCFGSENSRMAISMDMLKREPDTTYITKGNSARAIQPVLIARGGVFPRYFVFVVGQ